MSHRRTVLLWLGMSSVGLAHANTPVAANLTLPTTLNFQARDVRHDWVSADQVPVEVEANCTEQAQDDHAWWRGDQGTMIDHTCEDLSPASIAKLYSTLYRTSVTSRPGTGGGTTAHLVVHLPAGAGVITEVEWCVVPILEGATDEQLAAMRATWTSEEACTALHRTPVKGTQIDEPLPGDAVGVAYWATVVVGKDTLHTRGRRKLTGEALVKNDTGKKSAGGGGRGGALSALTSGIDQGAILVGLTDYLLQRADAELKAWALDSQVRELCEQKAQPGVLPGPGDVLHETCGAVQKEGISLLFSGASVLQNTARADMRALLRTLGEAFVTYGNGQPAVIDQSGVRQHDVTSAMAALGRTLELILDGDRPEDALAGFATDGGWAKGVHPDVAQLGRDYPITTALYLSAAVFGSLPADRTEATPPILPLGDEDSLYTVAAVEQNLRDAQMDGLTAALLGPRAANALPAAAKALLSSSAPQEIQAAIDQIKGLQARAQGLIDPDDVAANREAMLRAYGQIASLTLGLAADTLAAIRDETQDPNLDKAVQILRDTSTLAGQVAEARYAQAVAEALRMIATYVPTGSGSASPSAFGAELLNGLGFVASLALSESAQAAQDTIAAWAAPVGSYLRKHDGDGGYVGLNAYVGVGGGMEWVANVDGQTGLSNRALQAAPAMLVGVDAGHRAQNDCYAGAFFSVLDLGALATVRVGGEETTTNDQGEEVEVDYASKLRFQQVFAPGVYGMLAPARVPFAIGLGGSLAPSLREITVDGELVERDAPIVRATLLFALDLPLNP